METIDFGCQVRLVHRQRLTPGSSPPQLNQCASQFLAKVRQSTNGQSSGSTLKDDWMKLRLSHRGLRIVPQTLTSRRADEGFESDSEHSDGQSPTLLLGHQQQQQHDSGGSSGVNSSSSDIEEPETSLTPSHHSDKVTLAVNVGIRCRLDEILSCQHPPALGRHICLLTLKSENSALDIVAIECSAEEPARILTLLCHKICSSVGSANVQTPTATPVTCKPTQQQTSLVNIQSWSERSKSPPLPATAAATSSSSSGNGGTKGLIQRLERQHSSWMLRAGVKRSDTVIQPQNKTVVTKSASNGSSSSSSGSQSVVVSLQTPEAPLAVKTHRWLLGSRVAAVGRPTSPEAPAPPERIGRRGRSVERSAKPKAPEPPTPQQQPSSKIKRDPSKTRSFLMKLTSRSQKSPPASPVPAEVASNSSRGRSQTRRRSSPPPQTADKTFLIPTKSGQELTRHTYPKEAFNNGPPTTVQQPPPPSATGAALYHLVRPVHHLAAYHHAPIQPHWPAYCWNPELNDANNNQWYYYHHQPHLHHHHHHHQVAVNAQPQQQPLNRAELKRIQRSRSQSPGRQSRRWLAPGGSATAAAPVGHYHYAGPTSTGPPSVIQQQPVSLPVDLKDEPTSSKPASRSFRRSKSSSRMVVNRRATNSSSEAAAAAAPVPDSRCNANQHGSNNKAVTFHAFATVQLVD